MFSNFYKENLAYKIMKQYKWLLKVQEFQLMMQKSSISPDDKELQMIQCLKPLGYVMLQILKFDYITEIITLS